ncbi:FG-GAP-like repeat-containing protein [Chloroflexota bacterium]
MFTVKQHCYRRWLGLLIAGLAVLVLALVTFDVAASVAQPAEGVEVETAGRDAAAAPEDQASMSPLIPPGSPRQAVTPTLQTKAPPRGPKGATHASARPTTPGDVEISLLATTGLDGDQVVYNGERMTYTLTVVNSGGTPATNIVLYDLLPDGLGDIQCVGNCGRLIETELLPTPLGGFVAVSVTTGLTWPIPSLVPAGIAETAFTARVVGRPDGAVIRNTADLEYDDGIALSNETETMVRVRVEDDGQATLAEVPTWLSGDLGGTMSLDWGDFDADGYLDLALGSTVGTSVYRNDGGQLSFCWDIGVYTLGVRWADLDNDGDLELVAVGDSDDKTATSPGTNYVFDPDPDCTTPISQTFRSDHQLLRVEPAEYSNEGQVALVASTNAIDVPCAVRLIEGNGQGGFSDSFLDSPTDFRCVSSEASASMAPADYDRDGDPDLALGGFPNRTELAVNDSCQPAACWPPFIGSTILVPPATAFLAYDFACGVRNNVVWNSYRCWNPPFSPSRLR